MTLEIYEINNVVEIGETKTLVAEINVGFKGDKGDTGKSAFEQAVEGGYTGTEEEFNTYIAMLEKLGLILTNGNGTKYLANDGTYKEILIGSGGYSANLYFTTKNSDVTNYKKIEYVAESAQTELTIPCTTIEQLIRSYLFDFAIDTEVIDAGRWVSTYRAKVSSIQGARIRLEAFLRHTDNTETTLFSANSDLIINTTYATLKNETTQPLFNCATTDRLGFRIYASTTHPAGVTLNTIVGNGNASYITTPLSIRHSQLRDLNGDSNYLHVTSAEKTTWNGKVDKVATASRIYGVNASGNQTSFPIGSTTAIADSVVMRINTGAIVCATPTADNHATTKLYVDGIVPYYQTKTTLDATLVVGTIYELSELTGNISMALPSGTTRKRICVKFSCGATPYTFTLTGTNFTTFSLTPVANTSYDVEFEYNGATSKWTGYVNSYLA